MSVLAPESEAELAASIRSAWEAGEPLAIQGNGSKGAMLRPVQAARTLSTRALSGISLYAPNELILEAGAGTPLATVEAAVAAAGQQIIAEPPDLSALLGASSVQTIGGVVAANLSGPRRVAAGAMRDHLLGIRAVNGTGEVIRSGGRVLKNVTGLDLCKLLAGSHGTLGVLSAVTIKVLPAAESAGTLVLGGLDPARAVAALSAALGSPYGVSGAAFLPAAAAARVPALAGLGASATLVRIEEFAVSVAYRTARLRDDLARFGRADLLDDPASRAVWRAVRDVVPLAGGSEETVWRVSVRPSSGPAVLEAAEAAGGCGMLDWGGGLVWITAPTAAAEAVMAGARAAGGTWMLMRAPETLRAVLPVVPPEPPALARLTRAVKAAFDPKGILNPGRVFAGV